MTKDPVCGMQIEESKASAKSNYEGRLYSFCSLTCRHKFEDNPRKYTEKFEMNPGGEKNVAN